LQLRLLAASLFQKAMPAISLLHADCYRAWLLFFVMLRQVYPEQFILSLTKESIVVSVVLLLQSYT
jgi:hypothetical protein